MAAALMVLIHIIATRRNFPTEAPIPRSEIVGTVREALPALMLPVILLGGIYSGAVTPTEAAAVAAAYALLLAAGLLPRAGLRELLEILVRSRQVHRDRRHHHHRRPVLQLRRRREQIPKAFGVWIADSGLPAPFLLVINVLFLLLGCFLDTLLMLLVIVPIVIPSVRALGIDTVHFGVVIVVNMMIGLITPPYGEMLFLISGVTGIKLQAILKEIWPFLGALFLALLVMSLWPDLVLFLPRLAGYEG